MISIASVRVTSVQRLRSLWTAAEVIQSAAKCRCCSHRENDVTPRDCNINPPRLPFSKFASESTKLHMIDNQLVLTNYFECSHVDVISDIIADQFRLEFSIF